jgi:dolichol kinase
MTLLNKIPDLELKRKILHILIGIIGLVLLIFHIITPLIIFIVLVIGIITSLLSLKYNMPIICYFLDNCEREKDKKELPGRAVIFGVTSSLLVLKLFSENIALASIAILVFGDPISHLIGRALGKTNSIINPKKNIEGNIAGGLISSLFAMFFVPIPMAIAGSLIAMISELVMIKIQEIQLDDNLIIPLTAGTTMLLIKLFFF